MSALTPPQESQLLVKCDVVNLHGEHSTRLVELDAFRLWEYLMTTKHKLKVSNPVTCLWTPLDDPATREKDADQVDRITIDLFDPAYGFAQSSVRFTRHEETDRLVEILRSHVPRSLRESKDHGVSITPGTLTQHDQAALPDATKPLPA